MRLPRGINFALLALYPGLCFAEPQPDGERPPRVSFGTFPLSLKRTYVFSNFGTPVSKAKEMVSPFPDDVPPATIVAFEDLRRYPSLESGPRYMLTAKNILRVFNIEAMKTAPYKTIQPHVNLLRDLLKRRPAILRVDDNTSSGGESLPDYPPRNAAHLIDVKCSYLEAPWGTGVFYITQFVQDASYPDNEQLVYILQGLSNDGRFYISADFRITHPSLDNTKPSKTEDFEKLTQRLGATMAKDRDESFTPSLKRIRDWAAALQIE